VLRFASPRGDARAAAWPGPLAPVPAAAREEVAMSVLRRLDLLVLALALPVFLAAGFPVLGWLVTAVAWSLQRAVQLYALRRAREAPDPRTTIGVMAGSLLGRGWLVALAIVGALVADHEVGAAAAGLTLALFAAYCTAGVLLRPFAAPAAAGPLQPDGGAR
jgi:hypothetical protein